MSERRQRWRSSCVASALANVLPKDFRLLSPAHAAQWGTFAVKPLVSGLVRNSGHSLKVATRVRIPLGLPRNAGQCHFRAWSVCRTLTSCQQTWPKPQSSRGQECPFVAAAGAPDSSTREEAAEPDAVDRAYGLVGCSGERARRRRLARGDRHIKAGYGYDPRDVWALVPPACVPVVRPDTHRPRIEGARRGRWRSRRARCCSCSATRMPLPSSLSPWRRGRRHRQARPPACGHGTPQDRRPARTAGAAVPEWLRRFAASPLRRFAASPPMPNVSACSLPTGCTA
jgi:hypothetical protein